MDNEGKSIAQIVKENFEREVPEMIRMMVGLELHHIKWMYLSGIIFLIVLFVVFGPLLPFVI